MKLPACFKMSAVGLATRFTGIASGYAYLALSLLIIEEILGRKFLNISIQGVDEIGAYVVAITGVFGMSLAAWHRAHTRIDIILARLPASLRSLMDCVAYLGLLMGAVFMAYMGWKVFAETLSFNSVASTPLQTPLWIPQSMWLLGLISFSLIALIMCIRGCFLFFTGSPESRQFLAPTSVREDIERTSE